MDKRNIDRKSRIPGIINWELLNAFERLLCYRSEAFRIFWLFNVIYKQDYRGTTSLGTPMVSDAS